MMKTIRPGKSFADGSAGEPVNIAGHLSSSEGARLYEPGADQPIVGAGDGLSQNRKRNVAVLF